MVTNFSDTKQVIEHFQDLILLSNFLKGGYDAVMFEFIQKLKETGWGDDQIMKFIEVAGYGTFWEERIESPLPSLGDRREFDKNRARWRK